MNDYKELIERLRTDSLDSRKASISIMDLCMDAAAAIETLVTQLTASEAARTDLARRLALAQQEWEDPKPLTLGWISVKDRLPEAGGYVVCIAKRNPFSRFMPMVARIEKNGWVNPITEQYISEVTHWMPIPQPPKGE